MPNPKPKGIVHVNLPTPDAAASGHFFSQTLGWPTIPRPGNLSRKGIWMQIAEGQELHFNEVADFEPWSKELEYRRHVAIAYPLNQFDGLIGRIRDHGGELIDDERAGDTPRIFFRDPNGYLFEVVGTE